MHLKFEIHMHFLLSLSRQRHTLANIHTHTHTHTRVGKKVPVSFSMCEMRKRHTLSLHSKYSRISFCLMFFLGVFVKNKYFFSITLKIMQTRAIPCIYALFTNQKNTDLLFLFCDFFPLHFLVCHVFLKCFLFTISQSAFKNPDVAAWPHPQQ